jgi:hypothetical protein
VGRERQGQVGGRQTLPVIRDAHTLAPPLLHLDPHPRGAGVERVLDELLDDRRGPLDDFTGGDLVDEVVVEYADGHGRTF